MTRNVVPLYAAAQAEPVATVRISTTGGNAGIAWTGVPTDAAPLMRDGDKLYAAPQQAAQAEPLTLEKIHAVLVSVCDDDSCPTFDEFVADTSNECFIDFARAIERHHGIGGKP